MRIGHGYDVHRMKPGRRCILCGVEIQHELGPDGHSDADVPIHALMDALLGAAALGDIGQHFPDTDEKFRDANSLDLLRHVMRLISDGGYRLGNADITIVAQRPRLAPYISRMREQLAEVLGTGVEDINIKATTEEGLGITGDGMAIAAHVVVLLIQ